ncbi:MAG: hypothetical protein ACLP3C_25760 [Mycobacterium sp.]|uniref:hypothetical protein n=1 Tax=Mycobacterium sp. TaxID=1785 RepID=UPI003C352257
MAVAAFVLSLCALIMSLGAMVAAIMSVRFARLSANAANRSAELAEIVERGRRYGWRIEARTSDKPRRFYTLRNVGTVNARDVSLTGDYKELVFVDGQSSVDVAAGQARLFSTMQPSDNQPGEIHITWTPELPDAEPLTWTETPPPARQ